VIAATPPPVPAQRIHNLVLNVRSFDSIARQVWGGDAALVTLRLDSTLIRIDKARRGPRVTLVQEIATLEKHGTTALKTLDPTGSPLAEDAIQALRANLAAFRSVLKTLRG
jgi:hypothetical protein